MRRILWLCATGLFSLLAYMSQIGPDDAISNLASWYDKVAISPDWLKYPPLDMVWTVAFGLMAMLSLAAFLLPPHFFSPKPKPKTPEPATGLSPATLSALGITTAKARYAPPADTSGLDIQAVTYKELGALMEAIGKDILKFQKGIPYNATDEQVISQFHKKVAPHVLWAYEEARRRGHRDNTLDHFHSDPGALRVSNIEWIGKDLIKLGARLTLYIDS
jgi:hypothetical protein